MFTGLSAFPLTPLANDAVDTTAFTGLVRRLAAAQVDSITALGSTGSYAYLSTEERRRVAHLAVEHAGDIPVFVGIGALRTSQVLTHLEHAQQARARVSEIRAVIPEHVGIGVSGDGTAAAGMTAGCDAWYSVIAGTLPAPALRITRAALDGRVDEAATASERLAPLWELFAAFGSLRVVAAIAERLDLAPAACLPLPLHGLTDQQRAQVARIVDDLGLDRQR